jgi:hypothetical protein
MYFSNRYTAWIFPLCFCLLIIACDEKTKPASNEVTVNPAPTPNTQADKFASLGMDKSPMDMSYYPVDYPKLKMSGNVSDPLVARVIYSRPQKDGRIIFGNVLKYGAIWRLGANEATELEFFKDVNINNRKVAKGRYVLYAIPYEDKWTLVLNSDLFTWGLKIDTTKDVYKFEVPVSKIIRPIEVFTIDFQKTSPGMQLIMGWDSVRAALPIKYQ